jgi:hypothetical protein
MGDRVTVACARGDTGEGPVRWEGPQATRGHAQELEVVLGKLCRRWAAATEAEQGRSRGARGGRSRLESEGLVCNSQKFQGPFCKLRFPVDTKA